MSIKGIDEKVDAFFKLNADHVLSDLDVSLPDAFKLDSEGTIDAEDLALKVAKKRDEKSNGESNKNPSSAGNYSGKDNRVVNFFGSLVRGVFGSSKKQEEELRKLENDVRILNEQHHNLTSDIKDSMFDSLTTQSNSANGVNNSDSERNMSRFAQVNQANQKIDARSDVYRRTTEKADRMSKLKIKKGVQ